MTSDRTSDRSYAVDRVRLRFDKAIGPNIFYEDQLLDLETNGDANVSKAAARFFEFAGP